MVKPQGLSVLEFHIEKLDENGKVIVDKSKVIKRSVVDGSLTSSGTYSYYDTITEEGTYQFYVKGYDSYVSTTAVVASPIVKKVVKGEESPVSSGSSSSYIGLEAFPESYRDALADLNKKHPMWVFEKYDTGIDWNVFISSEDVGGKCQVNYPYVPSNWVEKDSPEYYPGWKAATVDVIKYYADPRNFLNERDIFQFEKLSYDSGTQTKEGVSRILYGTFMGNETYTQYFMDAAKESGASPYFLASKARLEMGSNGCTLSKGTVPGYEGYYNFYNIGAYGSNPALNGAIYAKKQGWDSVRNAIIGGAKFCASDFINKGQDTMYGFKFDLVEPEYFAHQYVENIQAAVHEGKKYYDGYLASGGIETPFKFKIPVFKNMPKDVCTKP